jgi:DNA-binding transcriptional ArsR family regulator
VASRMDTEYGDQFFGALADSTRRAILETLLERENMAAGQLAELFPEISRPAVSRHLRVLRQVDLVRETKDGREVLYRLNAAPLYNLQGWLRQFWMDKLDSLKSFVENDLDESKH